MEKIGYCGYCTDKVYNNNYVKHNNIIFCNDKCKNESIQQVERKQVIICSLNQLTPSERLDIFFEYCQECGELFENCICKS